MTTISNNDLKLKIIEIYDSKIKKDLESYAIEISDIFETIFNNKLKEEPDKYSLTHTNAGYLGKYYKVTHRVKSGWSLGEKLVKKDDLLRIKHTGEYEDEEKIKSYIKDRYSDLIGVKILGDLQHDTQNILKLIKDNKNKFKDSSSERYITFENLDKKQEKMKNGMEIIKIDCIYHKEGYKYNFELQIKSQLMSAWGDMEHQQFYKNNKFSVVRKSNEPIMSDIGKLLEKTDELLLTIRTSENKFSEHEELWQFTVDLQKEFSDKLEGILDVNVDTQLTDISDFLLLLFNTINPDKGKYNLDLDILQGVKVGDFDTEEYEELFIANYVKNRKLNFKLQILEIITLVWYGSLEEGIVNSKEGYILYVKWLINKLLRIIQSEYKIDTDSEVKFDTIFYEVLSHSNQNELFRDISYFDEIIAYYKVTKDTYIEMMEEEEEVFGLDVFYLINCLFSRHQINGESTDDIVIKIEETDVTLIDSFFEYLKKEIQGPLSKFLEISDKIHHRLRKEL